MEPLTFRLVTASDINEKFIEKMHEILLENDQPCDLPSLKSLLDDASFKFEDVEMMIAEQADNLVGFAFYCTLKGIVPRLMIYDIFIHPAYALPLQNPSAADILSGILKNIDEQYSVAAWGEIIVMNGVPVKEKSGLQLFYEDRGLTHLRGKLFISKAQS